MTRLRHTVLSVALAAAAMGAAAQPAAEQAPRTPNAPAAGQPPASQSGTAARRGDADRMAAMDRQMKIMREMHEKMARAKTPEERNALMAEHMKTIQEGMATMNIMGGPGMGPMGGMQGGKPMPGNMNERQQMMEKRMEMMQSMMRMMMDRLPPTPAK